MELHADPRPKAIHKYKVLHDFCCKDPYYGHYYCGFSYSTYFTFSYNIWITSFEAGSMFYIGYSEKLGVASAKVVDGIDVLKVMDRMKGIEPNGRMRKIEMPAINVVCGQLNDQCIKNHKLKNYGPKYHNIVTKKIQHQYVYRPGKEKDDECQYFFRLDRLWSTFPAALSIVNKMPFVFMASLFRWVEVPTGNEWLR